MALHKIKERQIISNRTSFVLFVLPITYQVQAGRYLKFIYDIITNKGSVLFKRNNKKLNDNNLVITLNLISYKIIQNILQKFLVFHTVLYNAVVPFLANVALIVAKLQ